MFSSARAQAQSWVLTGFVLTAIAGVISYFTQVLSFGYSFDSFREVVTPLLTPLQAGTAVLAWWWLSRIAPADATQLALLRNGFYALAVEDLLYSALWVSILLPLRSIGGFWTEASLWLDGVGPLVVAIGFVLLARSLDVPASVDVSGAVVESP